MDVHAKTRGGRSYWVRVGGTWGTTGEVAEKFGSGLRRVFASSGLEWDRGPVDPRRTRVPLCL